MKVTVDQALHLLSVLLVEDREEVRSIRNKIRNIVTSLVVASFAITSFMFDKKVVFPVKVYSCYIDFLIILLMIIVFWRLIIDLRWARRALEARENLVRSINCEIGDIEMDPFPPLSTVGDTYITDDDMWWVLVFGIGVMLLKIVIFWSAFP